MSWRHLNALLRGLLGREDSPWGRIVTAGVLESRENVWTPPQAPVGNTAEQEARLRAAFGLPRKAVTSDG